MDTKELAATLAHYQGLLKGLLMPLSDTALNTVPACGGWTAGQLSEHILLSNAAITSALNAKAVAAARNPVARIQELKEMLLSKTNRFDAAPFLCPALKEYTRQGVVEELQKSFQRIIVILPQLPEMEAVNIPGLGTLTKLELVHFVLYHTQRHVDQLQRITTHL